MAGTALDMLRFATSQLGITESPAGSNRTKYGAWYGMDGNAWCDMFVSWCAAQSGNGDAVGKFAYTPYHAAWFQKNGRWSFGANGIRPGDIVFYGGSAWGSANGIGGIQHVGTVERVISPTVIQVLEGNGLPLSTRVLTAEGWQPIGSLAVGTPMVDPRGGVSEVTGVFPQGVRPCFDLKFSDGRSIVADENHRWTVEVPGPPCREKVVTTADIAAMSAAGTRFQIVKMTHAPDLPGGNVVVDPWVVGALLGDGHFRRSQVMIATTEDWVVDEVRRRTGIEPVYQGGISNQWALPGLPETGITGIHFQKSIPAAYLGGSAKHRLSLLQGLLDTDGSVDKQGRAEFSSASEALSRQVLDLVWSLGGTAAWRVVDAPQYTYLLTGEKRTGRPAYQLRNIRMPVNPFSRPRKAARFTTMAERSMTRGWSVAAVEPVVAEETVCIAVSAPSQLYLAGDWVVTHNTSAAGSQDNGGAVLRKQRNTVLVCGYGRPAYASAAPSRPGVYTVIHTQSAPSNQGFTAALQRRLGIPADGSWGPQTTATLVAFQRAHGLAGDGVVGPGTAKALGWAFRP